MAAFVIEEMGEHLGDAARGGDAGKRRGEQKNQNETAGQPAHEATITATARNSIRISEPGKISRERDQDLQPILMLGHG